MDERDPGVEARAWAAAEIFRRELARGVVRVGVASTSMGPMARRGDEFLIAAPVGGEPRFGEVVLAVAGGRPVTHRLVGRRGALYILKGDGSPALDPPVARGDLLGVAHALVRGGRAVRLSGFRARAGALCLASLSLAENALHRLGAPVTLTRKVFYLAMWAPARVLLS